MVDIVAATGTTITVPDEAINVVSGPYHSDSGTKSYVRGNFGPGALESKEDASHLVGRLQVTLAMLTRPNGTPVWVKTRAIAILRYPLDTEIQGPTNLVRSVIVVGGFLQALQEDIATVRQIMSKSAPGALATSSALTRVWARHVAGRNNDSARLGCRRMRNPIWKRSAGQWCGRSSPRQECRGRSTT